MLEATDQHDIGTNGQPLLLTAREAAELLNVSEKTLWNHSGDRGGKIPVVRFGRTLRYSRAALEKWITEQAATG